MFEYKILEIKHYAEVVQIWENTVGLGPNDTEESLKKYLEINKGMSFICVDRNTGKIVGAVLGGNDGRHGYIYHLAVKNEYRNNNIGNSLINHSTEAIKRSGIIRCIIAIRKENQSGCDFWKKIGWKNMEQLNMYSIEL